MARVLIAGCGYVGTALATKLTAAGHRVWGLRRSARALPTGVRPCPADLGARASLRTALRSIASEADDADATQARALDCVVMTAAASEPTETSYRATYVDGLGNLLRALEGEGLSPRRLLVASSTSVYAQGRGEWVDECSPTEPSHFAGHVQLEAEALARESSLACTIVRLGGLYGPGRTTLLEAVRGGRIWQGRMLDRYTNRMHREDAAAALAFLTDRDAAGGALPDLVLGVDDEPARLVTVARWLARQLGVPHPASEEEALAVARDAGATPASRATTSKRCSNRRLRELGFGLLYPTFREGYAPLLAPEASSERPPISER